MIALFFYTASNLAKALMSYLGNASSVCSFWVKPAAQLR